MDPDSNLNEQLQIARGLLADDEDKMSSSDMASALHSALRLAEYVVALDEWIRKGGFLPSSWRT
jgi:hypothetical protein